MPIGKYPFSDALPDNYIFISQGYKIFHKAAIKLGLYSLDM